MSLEYLVIEGNIGAGKTTLSKMLSEDLNAELLLERFTNNPFLAKFYDDPQKYALPLELSFLKDRFSQSESIHHSIGTTNKLTISDYFFVKSLIFAKCNLMGEEYTLYEELFKIIYDRLPKPDLYVYLHLSEARLIEHIQKRGREYEQTIKIDYLTAIKEQYFNFFSRQDDFPVLILHTDGLDFVNKTTDYQIIRDTIVNKVHTAPLSHIFFHSENT
jgi:deoxyguanosine kinase